MIHKNDQSRRKIKARKWEIAERDQAIEKNHCNARNRIQRFIKKICKSGKRAWRLQNARII